MPVLIGITAVLTLSGVALLWRLGSSRKRQWSERAAPESAPFDNALNVGYHGVNHALIRSMVEKRVLSECSYTPVMRRDIDTRVMEILKTSPATRRVLIETERLYKEAASKHSLAAAFYMRRLSRKLAVVMANGRIEAASELRLTVEQLNSPEFSAMFEDDETFDRVLAENGLKIA